MDPVEMGMDENCIQTERLLLRPMEEADLDDLFQIFSDPRVMESFDEEPFSRRQMIYWLNRNLGHQERYGYGLFAVILKTTGELIGNCGIEHMEVEGKQSAELGYDFRSDHWNQGYATEAATAIRDHAFGNLELPGLISLIRVGNQASKRVSEKIGMRLAEEIERNGISYWIYKIQNEGQ